MNFNDTWMNHMLDMLEQKNDFKVLESCGSKCVTWSGMDKLMEAANLGKAYDHKDLAKLLLQSPMKEHHIILEDNYVGMTYNMKACVCPVMKDVSHPHACECTKGFIKQIVGMISHSPLDEIIVDSYIRNNKPCSFQIRMI